MTEPAQPSVTRTVTLTLLTQIDCDLCDHAKKVLAKVSTTPVTGVTVVIQEVDLRSPEGRALGESAGVLFAPGVLLDGIPFSHGRLSERKLRRTLAAHSTASTSK